MEKTQYHLAFNVSADFLMPFGSSSCFRSIVHIDNTIGQSPSRQG